MEIEFMEKGGIVMWPILISSIFALAILFERFYTFWKTKTASSRFLSKVHILIKNEKISEAITECEKAKIPVASMFRTGLMNRHKERGEIKALMEEVGELEVVNLEKYLPGLSTVATITPLLGLLGTVTGMVSSFNAIAASTAGVGETHMLATGIAEALLTTVFGLAVAIPSLVAYNYLIKQVDNIIFKMEQSSLELLDVLLDMNTKVVDDLIKESNK